MFTAWLAVARPLLFSVLLHIFLGVVLIFSFEFTPAPPPTLPKVNIVKAQSVDKAAVEKELKRLADADKAKQEAEKKKQRELEKKAEEAKKKRLEEERKLKEIKKKKEQALKKQKEADKKKKLELEKKKKAEAEAKKKKLAEEKKKREAEEAERKRKEEAEKKRKAEEERKQREAEAALQADLEAEQQAFQDQQDLTEIQKYTILIGRSIESKFNRLGLPDGLSCEILIRLLEGGKVADVTIAKSSGNELFDKRAEDAVYKASPLPVPDEARVFNKMRTIQILFRPKS